jgi:excisionase family DNA binding protein
MRRKIEDLRLPLLLPVADAAGELGVSVRTVRGLIAAGELEVVKIGGRITRVRRESLLKLARRGVAARSIRGREELA